MNVMMVQRLHDYIQTVNSNCLCNYSQCLVVRGFDPSLRIDWVSSHSSQTSAETWLIRTDKQQYYGVFLEV